MLHKTAHRHNGDGPHAVRLSIPAKAEYITLVRLALTGLAHLHPLSEETLGDLKLAVTEACSNSVRHAYGNGGDGVVDILYELRTDRLVVEVADNGTGFAHGESSPRGDLDEGGLGIAIIQAVADEFEVRAGRDGAGSRLRFVKLLQE
ncbi:MAG: ATP-binding protein [Gaiellaceae bacterium]